MNKKLKEFVRHLDLGVAFFAQFIKARMSYRFDFFISLVATLLSSIIGLLFLYVLFKRIPNLAGWSFYEVLFIYGFSLVPAALFSLVSINLWSFGSKFIIEGNLDRILTRPIHSLFQILCESLRIESLQDILVGTAMVFYAGSRLGVEFGVLPVLVFVSLSISGALVLLAFFSIIATVNFWIEDRVGIEAPFFNMLSLGRYPLTIYNGFLRVLLSTAIPFAYAAFFPSMWFVRRGDYLLMIILCPLVAIGYSILALWVWNRGIKAYGSTGS